MRIYLFIVGDRDGVDTEIPINDLCSDVQIDGRGDFAPNGAAAVNAYVRGNHPFERGEWLHHFLICIPQRIEFQFKVELRRAVTIPYLLRVELSDGGNVEFGLNPSANFLEFFTQ